MALVVYRDLVRAARIAFNGDAPVLAAAQQHIRQEFRRKASLDSSDSSTKEAVQHAAEVAHFLRANLVQGKKLDGEDDVYHLHIHEHTERGNNDTVNVGSPGGTNGAGAGGRRCK